MTLSLGDLSEAAAELGALLDAGWVTRGFRARYNVAPTDVHPVMVLRQTVPDGPRTLVPATWGFPADGNRPAMINARSETAPFRASFRQAFADRRCVVVSDGFLEWKRDPADAAARRRPMWFHRADGGLLLLAGLYDDQNAQQQATAGGEGDDGALLRFTVLTTGPNALVAPVHDRMPAVLPTEAAVSAWLARPDRALLRPAPDGLLIATPVSSRVNSVKNDDPACLGPAEAEPPPRAQLALF